MLNWGIIGAGGIAYVFCNGMRFTDTGQIFAVASRTPARREKLANDFNIPRQYDSYEALLADEDVDVVYISTIHPLHAEWAIKAAEAKKHILVEKPISMNHAEASAMIEAARANDVFLMEAFMYRCHPQIEKVVQLIQEGEIGELLVIRATFSHRVDFNPDSRIFNHEMGGGGILDLGCYTASMARKMAGAADNKPFLNPISVKANGKLTSTGVDGIASATLKFENGIIGEIFCAVECRVGSTVTLYGSEGTITIPQPWLPSSACRQAKQPLPHDTEFPTASFYVDIHRTGAASERFVPVDKDLFTYEAEMVANHIAARQAPAMPWDDTLGNMQLLDTWREEIGVVV